MTAVSDAAKRLMRFESLPIPNSSLPKGKGVFLYKADRIGSPDEIVQKAVAAGFDWVAIKLQNGRMMTDGFVVESIFLNLPIRETVRALQKAGIKVIGWGYVYSNSDDQVLWEIAKTVDAIRYYGVDGWIVNAEEHSKNQQTRSKRYLDGLRFFLGSEYWLGFSSYRFPSVHLSFPWQEYISACDYAVPQVYWLLAHNPASQLEKCLNEHDGLAEKYGNPDLEIIPAGSAYPYGTWKPSVFELKQFYEAVQVYHLSGWTWWEWYYINQEPEWLAEITRHDGSGDGGTEAPVDKEAWRSMANDIRLVRLKVNEFLLGLSDLVADHWQDVKDLEKLESIAEENGR